MPFFSLCIISAVGQIALTRRTTKEGEKGDGEVQRELGRQGGWPRTTKANTIVAIATVSSRSWLDCYLLTQWRTQFPVSLRVHRAKKINLSWAINYRL